MNYITTFRFVFLFLLTVLSLRSEALPLSVYSSESVLASGKWIKISVDDNGLYRIPASTLRSWGFANSSAVRIHGYGGNRIADALTEADYIDDLPVVPSVICADGSIVFYGVGPYTWDNSTPMVRRSNPYSVAGYYFITENESEVPTFESTAVPGASAPATSFTERLQHEQDLVSPGEAGQFLVGEDFKYTPTRRFHFDLPDICGNLTFLTSFVTKTAGGASRLQFSANGVDVPTTSTDVISAVSSAHDVYGTEGRTTHTLKDISGSLDLTVSLTSSVMITSAWLNYIAVNYERSLRLPASGYLAFNSGSKELSLGNVSSAVKIWDVTDPSDISVVNCEISESSAKWTVSESGSRSYVAWNENAVLPNPVFVSNVPNQNLHADQCADMVIFTHQAWRAQAERIAELHRGAPDNFKVIVVNAEDVYNEFSSGSPDVSGLRKYIKMLYDRGNEGDTKLGYVLLMGRMTYDERHVTSAVQALGVPTLPAWQQRDDKLSLNAEYGFATDDFLAMLEDGSGLRLGSDKLSVAVGRIPVTSVSSAKTIADKIIDYVRKPSPGTWKNRVMSLADDLDAGVHYKQTEWLTRGIARNSNNPYIIEKIYLPAFEKSNGVYQLARDKMMRTLDEGVTWWTFVGHATNHSWTADGMLKYTDINSLYLRRLPFVYASTCNFLRWDSNTQSGGEILMNEKNGGVIGMISATRPVYITYNGYFTNAIGKEISRRDANGRLLPSGEVYRRAKNNIRSIDDNGIESTSVINNENRLRYVFMGDPALHLATPDNLIAIESVNDVAVKGPDQIILPARGMPVIKGYVMSPDGTVMSDFNGTLFLDLYDADRSTTLKGSEYSQMLPFDQHGEKLYSGACRVVSGRFELTVAMPSDISDNFREATVSMYAYTDDSTVEATGIDHNCYVYGFDEGADDDKQLPVIEFMALNHPSFKDGDIVNSSPVLIANVSDNVGINLSSAGIGRQMSIMLDDKRSYNDVSMYFTPASDGSPSGEIVYPLDDLVEGMHTLRLRVFDTNGNSATKTIEFFVREGLAPTIFDIYSDVNPATTEANFYLSHNRPDGMLSVTVSVYNLLGHLVWSQTSTGQSDMFTSSPVTWNLTDRTGRRVPRGIYVYSATVSADGENFSTASRKIAVTAP